MNGLYTVSRVLTGFFGFTVLLSVLWFASSLGGAFIVASVLMGFSSLVVAFVPRRKLSSVAIRRTLVTFCALGIGAGVSLIANDLGASLGIEWDVVAIRMLHIVALAAMAVIALRQPPEQT